MKTSQKINRNSYYAYRSIYWWFPFLGRSSNKVKSKIVNINEKPVIGNVTFPTPQKVSYQQILLPFKIIFVGNQQVQIVDTAKIIEEYSTKRTYEFPLFDNEWGKLDLKPTLQYNKLIDMPYIFKPISKREIVIPKWEFFVSASYNTFNIAGTGVGMFYNNLGIEYKFLNQIKHRRLRSRIRD